MTPAFDWLKPSQQQLSWCNTCKKLTTSKNATNTIHCSECFGTKGIIDTIDDDKH